MTEVEASLDEVCNVNSAAAAPVKGPVYLPDIKFIRSWYYAAAAASQ